MSKINISSIAIYFNKLIVKLLTINNSIAIINHRKAKRGRRKR